jgi:glycosyltransferase involved in cell wall biosynthesis
VKVVPNGVDLEYFRPMPAVSKSTSLVFVGSLDWYPNEDAVKEFAFRIFPLIRRKNERITFRVVGRKQSISLTNALQGIDGVELIGEVPDVRQYVAEAAAVVVPLRIGGGTRIKILEALAMQKPVVSTSIGAEGLELKDGRDLLIANTPEQFAAQIESLLLNKELQQELGRNGRSVVEKFYGWDSLAGNLEQAWLATAARQPAATANELALAEVRR